MAFQYWQHRGGQHVRRRSFICLEDGYHGDTIGSVSVGGIDLFHSAFGPLLFDSHRARAGRHRAHGASCSSRHEEELVAVIVEPLVQGAAGMIMHPPGYLRAVRELCDRHGVLLICDEVATGFGRTGTMFACEQEDVSPDLMCLAQGPDRRLHAARRHARDRADLRGLPRRARPSTRPSSTATRTRATRSPARRRSASLDVFEFERTLETMQPKSRLFGELLGRVEAMAEVSEVRRRGFMVGIDLGEHDPELRIGHRVALEARERGVIVRPLGDVVILMPPLSISKAELRTLVSVVAASIRAAFPVAELDPAAAWRSQAALLDAA